MKKKTGTGQQQQLQISSFIKEPASLKLLILAGTNIKPVQLTTIAKCAGLIKLDLSNNFLEQMPIKFTTFPNLKILYLHDNQLTHVEVKGIQIQYISLFKNIIQPSIYRKQLIRSNDSLLGIDFNIITQKQKYRDNCQSSLPAFSEIKWPIVEIQSTLENEDDYLNLLKAQIFVINNVYKRTIQIQKIQWAMHGFIGVRKFNIFKKQSKSKFHILPSVIKAVEKWKQFTKLKKKLRKMLQKKHKQNLLLNSLQRKRMARSKQTGATIDNYLSFMRIRMRARGPLTRKLNQYKLYIHSHWSLYQKYLGFQKQRNYVQNPIKLYFRQSQLDILSKVTLYAKKLLFKKKQYDLCDQFNNLFKQTGRKFIIYRKNKENKDKIPWIMNSIHETTGYVLKQLGIDRKHFLYTKKGHKGIQIKNIHKPQKLKTEQLDKINYINRKMNNRQQRYDKLIQFGVYNFQILKKLLKIMRFINAGNGHNIVHTQTAYFQTQVILDQDKNKQQIAKINFGLQFFVKRVIAANVIQKWWRKKLSQLRSINVIEVLKKKRAQALVSKMIRNIIFRHRLASLKYRSYLSCLWKSTQVYLHLDIYMNMLKPTNFLRFSETITEVNSFYQILHKGTQVKIVQTQGRKWIRIHYSTSEQAYAAQIVFHKFTYRYWKGFYVKLFTAFEINDTKQLVQYENKLQQLCSIKVNVANNQEIQSLKTILNIDNPQPYFVWSQVHALQHSSKFSGIQKHNTNVSIFIYNKHKRPLKVSCQFYWAIPFSLYSNKKTKSITKQSNSNSLFQNQGSRLQKAKNYLQSGIDNQIGIIDFEYNLKKNNNQRHRIDLPKRLQMKQITRHKNSVGAKTVSLTKTHRTRRISQSKLQKLSQTLNIRGK